ncbi:MAG: hypothetical protein WC758_08460 [Candidatus Woesearchaeota archaeon]|jgi:predicted Zn-ribbon and HTH transcriptional regulator
METEYKCKRCNYEWKSRVAKPATCPRCKSYYYESVKKLNSETIQKNNDN